MKKKKCKRHANKFVYTDLVQYGQGMKREEIRERFKGTFLNHQTVD